MDKRRIVVAIIVIAIIAVGSLAFISANAHVTKLEFISNSTLQNGDLIKIKLTDDYRNVYPNETIDVKILDDSGWAYKYQAVTDEFGIASIELITFDNGNYTVHYYYNGTLFNKGCQDEKPIAIDDGF